MGEIIIDFETRSTCDIKKHGAARYATDPETSLLSVSFQLKEKLYSFTILDGFDEAAEILSGFSGKIVAHNWLFEYLIFKHVWTDRRLDHFRKPEHYVCTQALAHRYGLPATLEAATNSLGLLNRKHADEGKKLIQKFSVPDRKTGHFREMTVEDHLAFLEYGRQDVRATFELYKKLRGLDDFERLAFELDKKINSRGLHIDTKAAEKLNIAWLEIYRRAQSEAENLLGKNKTGTIAVNSNPFLLKYLNDQGYDLDNVQAANLDAILAKKPKTKQDKQIHRVINLRKILSAKAPAKLQAILDMHVDGFLYGILQYYGGHTGRWSGRGVQIHNFVRAKMDEKDFGKTIDNLIEHNYNVDEEIETIRKLLRLLIIPHPGNEFVRGDLSAIEARVVMWLAGAKRGLATFKSGEDIYSYFASMLNLPGKFDKDTKRQIGKSGVLGLGFGMGLNRFIEYLAGYIGYKDRVISKMVVDTYRKKMFPEVVQLWYDVENAFKQAIKTRKSVNINDKITVKPVKAGLKVILPSGRAIYYRGAGVKNGKFFFNHPRYGKIYQWGGGLVENIVQAIARDVMLSAMIEIDNTDIMTVAFTVHDEIIAETNKRHAAKALKIFDEIMNKSPSWAPDLPIKAESQRGKRYGK